MRHPLYKGRRAVPEGDGSLIGRVGLLTLAPLPHRVMLCWLTPNQLDRDLLPVKRGERAARELFVHRLAEVFQDRNSNGLAEPERLRVV